MPSKIITEELKQEIREYYLSQPMSLATVGEKFNLSNPTISKILKDIPKYKKAQIFNPQLNEHLFKEINSEESAYFLGLLISDGNVFISENGNRQASISITLNLKDEYMLETFKKVTNSNTSIGHDGRGCGQIAIRSNIMAKDLEQYGIIPRKSSLTYLPLNINLEYMNHLIRGIFDGDGSIQAKINNNKYLHAISFCGTHKLMEDISNYIYKNLPLNQKPTVYDYTNRNLSEIKIQNRHDMYIFGEWMYNNSTIFLTRKHNKYLEFKQHYNL